MARGCPDRGPSPSAAAPAAPREVVVPDVPESPHRRPASRRPRSSAHHHRPARKPFALLLRLDRDSPTGASARPQWQLDPQYAALVGGPGLLGDHVGVQLNDATERARLDLHLLVDPALGLLDGPLAADHELPPDDLEAHGVEANSRQLGLDDRPWRLAAVVDVDARRKARL